MTVALFLACAWSCASDDERESRRDCIDAHMEWINDNCVNRTGK